MIQNVKFNASTCDGLKNAVKTCSAEETRSGCVVANNRFQIVWRSVNGKEVTRDWEDTRQANVAPGAPMPKFNLPMYFCNEGGGKDNWGSNGGVGKDPDPGAAKACFVRCSGGRPLQSR